MENIKISPEDLVRVQESQQKIQQNVFELGQIEIYIHNSQDVLDNYKKQKEEQLLLLKALSEQEIKLLKELESKYGKGSLNMSTGEIQAP